MDRAVYPHDMHATDDILDAVPVAAYEHQLTFLMSYPICEHGKRARKSGAHTADAILFLASGNTAEFGEVVRVFAPYVVKKEKGQKIVQTLSVSRNVDFHDLDLNRAGDVATLKQRVIQATQDVCRELESRYSSGDWKLFAEDRLGARSASTRALAEIHMI